MGGHATEEELLTIVLTTVGSQVLGTTLARFSRGSASTEVARTRREVKERISDGWKGKGKKRKNSRQAKSKERPRQGETDWRLSRLKIRGTQLARLIDPEERRSIIELTTDRHGGLCAGVGCPTVVDGLHACRSSITFEFQTCALPQPITCDSPTAQTAAKHVVKGSTAVHESTDSS